MKRIKILNIIIILVLIVSCTNRPEKKILKFDKPVSEIVMSNEKCEIIFKEKFGVREEEREGYLYLDYMFNNLDKKSEYSRLLLLKLVESGEIVENTDLGVQVFTDGDAIVTINLIDDKKKESKQISNFSVSRLYNQLDGLQEAKVSNGTKLIVVDFKNSDDCECSFYENINRDEIANIKSLDFFK